MTRVLVDADIIAYRHAFKADTDLLRFEDMCDNIDEMVQYVAQRTTFGDGDVGLLDFFLTGDTNFRKELATIAPYKGTRSKEKPSMFYEARGYLRDEYNATTSVDQEADDDIAIAAHGYDYKCTVASADKDFLQLPCTIYNWGRDTITKQDAKEATLFFYTQLLTGDSSDNIKGVPRIGPKKAAKIYEGLTEEYDLYKAALETYMTKYDNDSALPALIENARLLWLRREEGQMWEPPKEK